MNGEQKALPPLPETPYELMMSAEADDMFGRGFNLAEPGYSEHQMRAYASAAGAVALRDYFAAKALVAMLGNPNKDTRNLGKKGLSTFPGYAYEWADAMLKAREQR